MNLMQVLREKAYWAIDAVKGSPVQKHLRHISANLQNRGSTFAADQNSVALQELLQHATQNIPYYKNLNLPLKLEAFPVTDKNLIREHEHEFLIPGTAKQKLHKVTTSGSTGTPFTVYQNKDKKNRNVADVLYFAKTSGFQLGYRLYYFRHWDRQLKKAKPLAYLQNVIPLEVTYLSDSYISSFLARLKKDPTPKAFIGYPSAYNSIVNYMQRNAKKPKDYNITSIIANAETLTRDTKEGMEYYFKCPVVSRYSNMENGILAQQMPGKDPYFHINTASYVIEVLDMYTGQPVLDEPGNIVVTDLYNYSMPLIRYTTGDIGLMTKDPKTGIPMLARVDGRKMDVILNTKGEVLSAFVSLNTLQYEGILQTQMIQEGPKEYRIRLCITDDFNSEEAIKNEYLEILGKDARIVFEYPDEIPLLSSGKRKIMINNYLKKVQDLKND